MGIFDFFRRRKSSNPEMVSKHESYDPGTIIKPESSVSETVIKRESLSRVEYLIYLSQDSLEARPEGWDGLNFTELIERQISDGKIDLAISNCGFFINDCFRLVILYWGQGEIETAKSYINLILEKHNKAITLSSKHNKKYQPHMADVYAKVAAYLLEDKDFKFKQSDKEMGYEPWFIGRLIDYCWKNDDFDVADWQAAEDTWIKRRFPKYKLEEFDVYVKALTGQYETTQDMLAAHKAMFTGRAKRKNTDSGLLDGYDDNELIIDYIFACILKRIGWEGRYRHSWPKTDIVDSSPETNIEPDKYLKIIAAPEPEIDQSSGIIADVQKARRYIDFHLKNQLFEGEDYFSADRLAKTRSKVSGTLRKLGWVKDPATLDLMRAYRMDNVLNDETHIVLCDPVEGDFCLESWTKNLQDEFGLHCDFIAIAGSEEKSDYMDPQGFWYVYWKKDKKVYSVERDDWGDPIKATENARLGLTKWPSYTSFIAWWVSEHLESEFFETPS